MILTFVIFLILKQLFKKERLTDFVVLDEDLDYQVTHLDREDSGSGSQWAIVRRNTDDGDCLMQISTNNSILVKGQTNSLAK